MLHAFFITEKEEPKVLPSNDDQLPSLRAILQNAINDGNLTLGRRPMRPKPTEPPTPPASSCRASNGDIMKNGATWCPIPQIRCECHSGHVTYLTHLCPALSCSNPVRGERGTCECPYCPGKCCSLY